MMKEKTPFGGQICALSDRNKRQSYFSEKLLLSQNQCYFRWSHFSQCFVLSTALQCSFTKSIFKLTFVLSNYQTWTFPLKSIIFLYDYEICKIHFFQKSMTFLATLLHSSKNTKTFFLNSVTVSAHRRIWTPFVSIVLETVGGTLSVKLINRKCKTLTTFQTKIHMHWSRKSGKMGLFYEENVQETYHSMLDPTLPSCWDL